MLLSLCWFGWEDDAAVAFVCADSVQICVEEHGGTYVFYECVCAYWSCPGSYKRGSWAVACWGFMSQRYLGADRYCRWTDKTKKKKEQRSGLAMHNHPSASVILPGLLSLDHPLLSQPWMSHFQHPGSVQSLWINHTFLSSLLSHNTSLNKRTHWFHRSKMQDSFCPGVEGMLCVALLFNNLVGLKCWVCYSPILKSPCW